MRTVFILVGIVIIGLVIVGGWMWYMSYQPLYKPGHVRAQKNLRAPLTPLAQNGTPDFWQMEEDIALYHESVGSGRNVLIIHGGPGSPYATTWAGVEGLTDDYTFHFYHQRGSGRSSRPIDTFDGGNFLQNVTTLDQTLGIGAQLADIERIRQLLGDEQLIIIGHSYGGFLASLYAAEFPEHVAGLVLLVPADLLLFPQQGPGFYDEIGNRLPAEMKAEYEAYSARFLDFSTLFEKSEDDLVALNEEMQPYFQTALGREIPQFERGGGWMPFAQFMSMGRRHDYRDALTTVQAPVLVIHGADDLLSERVSRSYAELFPNGSLTVIDDATHFPFDEQPEQFGKHVGQFLRTLK